MGDYPTHKSKNHLVGVYRLIISHHRQPGLLLHLPVTIYLSFLASSRHMHMATALAISMPGATVSAYVCFPISMSLPLNSLRSICATTSSPSLISADRWKKSPFMVSVTGLPLAVSTKKTSNLREPTLKQSARQIFDTCKKVCCKREGVNLRPNLAFTCKIFFPWGSWA